MIFSEMGGRGRRRTFTLAQSVIALCAVFVVLPVVTGGAAFWLHRQLVARPAVSAPGASWVATADRVRRLRVLSPADLAVLARRVGTLVAQASRLEVLGARLSRMAGIAAVYPRPRSTASWADDRSVPTVAGVAARVAALRRQLIDQRMEWAALAPVVVEHQVRLITTPNGWPVRGGWISSPFGPRPNPFTGRPGFHPGVDIAAPIGTPVRAMAAGVVVFASHDGGFGRVIKVFDGHGQITLYAHLSARYVHAGEIICPGQLIGRVGDTGYSTGPHLHFEVLSYGTPINPIGFLHPSDHRCRRMCSSGRLFRP